MSRQGKSVSDRDHPDSEIRIAEMVQRACIEAARKGFEEALMSGLCIEGAMETATGAIQSLDLEKVLTDSESAAPIETSHPRRPESHQRTD